MPKNIQPEIKVGSTIDLKEVEKIDRELQDLARSDPRELILRLAGLGRTAEARDHLKNLEDAYRLKVGELQKVLADAQKPPLRDAIFLKPSPDAPNENAIVGIGGSRMEVAIAATPPGPIAALAGCEVWINGENQIVRFRDAYVRGEAAEVVDVPDGLRLRVKGQGHEEIIVERLPPIQDQTVEAGDTVRIHPGLGVAFEKLTGKEKRAIEPERIPSVRYDQIGGLEFQIDEIREAIEHPFLYRHIYKEYGLKRPKGILLHGPPGCGKTMVAKAIADSLSQEIRQRLTWNVEALQLYLESDLSNEAMVARFRQWLVGLRTTDRPQMPDVGSPGHEDYKKALGEYLRDQRIELDNGVAVLDRLRKAASEEGRGFFLSINGPELLNKFVGETEYSIRRIFMLARKKASADTPVVIFFDELESMFSRRGSGVSSDIESTVVPQLLSEIDGMDELSDVVIIGASNRYDLIDPAVLRPGRLDLKILVGRPNQDSAAAILKKYLTLHLPFAPRTLEEFGGAEEAAGGLVSRIVKTIYSPQSFLQIYEKADRNELMNREHRMPLQKRKAIGEIVSGAMLESIVNRVKRSAVKRELGGEVRGICWQPDVLEAIRSECEESKEQYISEIRPTRDIASAESFAVEVHLDDASPDASAVGGAKWFQGKARPWVTAN